MLAAGTHPSVVTDLSRQEAREVDFPGPGEVQIVPVVTTLCGSDLHYYKDYANGAIQVQHPLVLGHESSGTISAVSGTQTCTTCPKNACGPKCTRVLKPGDRVAIEPGVPCNTCDKCKEGRYNICKQMRFLSSAKSVSHADGTLQNLLNHPAKYCHKYV